MRKIVSREQKDKKTRQNQIIIGVVLIAVMVFGTLGYAFSGGSKEDSNENKLNYKGIEFVQDNSKYWRFDIQGYDFATKYNPQETENISFFSYSSINDYINEPLYFVSEFQEPVFEISQNLNQFVSRVNEACLNEDCKKDFPIKNCSVDNIIIIKELEGEIKEIRQEENCVFIISDLGNQTKYADAFLFRILGL